MHRPQLSPRSSSENDLATDSSIKELNIFSRVCCSFVPKSSDGERCCCGQPKFVHPLAKNTRDIPKLPKTAAWTVERNTKKKPNAACGRIRRGPRFVQVAIDTEPEKIMKILLECWKLTSPHFIVSIIGGKRPLKIKEQLEIKLINSISEIIKRPNTWLVTGGYRTGVEQIVGEAIKQFKSSDCKNEKVTAIGICKWGNIKNVDKITQLNYNEDDEYSSETNAEKRLHLFGDSADSQFDVEMNHTHFILIDDGRFCCSEMGDCRTRIIELLAGSDEESDIFVPTATVVVEGDKNTLTGIYYDLKALIPVIVVEGSGGVADILSRWLLLTKKLENSTDEQENIYDIDELGVDIDDIESTKHYHLSAKRTKLQAIFSKYKEQIAEDIKSTLIQNNDLSQNSTTIDRKSSKTSKEIDQLTKKVLYCLQPGVRFRLSIFNINSMYDLAETIFRNICYSKLRDSISEPNIRSHPDESGQQRDATPTNNALQNDHFATAKQNKDIKRTKLLNVAMKMNYIEAAREYIFDASLHNLMNQQKYFRDALDSDIPAFVYEFLELGFEPAEIFYGNIKSGNYSSYYDNLITILYKKKLVNDEKTQLKDFVTNSEGEKDISDIRTLNRVVRELIGDYMNDIYDKGQRKEDGGRKTHESGGIDAEKKDGSSSLATMQKQYIMRDLFLWAVLINRIDMAKVFLAFMEYRICPALIASKIMKKYHEKATYGEVKKKYSNDKDYFEQYAVECLKRCQENDIDQSCQIVLQENKDWGSVTCLQVAISANNKEFISQPPCTLAVDNIWYDQLCSKKLKPIERVGFVIGVLTLGLLAPLCVKYREKKQENRNDRMESKFSLEDHGINYSDPKFVEFRHSTKSGANSACDFYSPRLNKFHNALIVKYIYHFVAYVFFVLLFSYVLLFKFSLPTDKTPSIDWTEIYTIVLVSCMLIEEIHYFFSQDEIKLIEKLKHYFLNLKGVLLTITFILFYIGLILRFTCTSSEINFTAARVVMAIDVELWWLRCILFIIVIPKIGPYIVSLAKMLQDLLFFICILAIVIIGYGVASRSMVYYPNENGLTINSGGTTDPSFDGRAVFRQVIYPVYYILFGEFGNETDVLDQNKNYGWSISNHVLLAFHMIFVNVLLVNLLIAIFSKRVTEVADDAKRIWYSQKYSYTREYFTRTPFLPPLNIIFDIFFLCSMLYYHIQKKRSNNFSGENGKRIFKMIAKQESTRKAWREFEAASTVDYARHEATAQSESLKKKTGSTTISGKTKSDGAQSDKEQSLVKKIRRDIDYLNVVLKPIDSKNKEASQQSHSVNN